MIAASPMTENSVTNNGLVARRVDIPCAVAGFAPPPCRVHLKFQRHARGWKATVLTPPGRPPMVARWIESYGPATVRVPPGLSPHFLEAEFDELPGLWARFLEAVAVRNVELAPAGTASLFVEDEPRRIDAFVRSLAAGQPVARIRKTSFGTKEAVQLTSRQLEVLSLAVAMGYYELPHRATLRGLAQKLGLSLGAVSEVLRRAESVIISSYVDSLAEADWVASDAEP